MEAEKCEGFIHGTRQGRTNPSGPAASQGMQEKIQNHRIYTSLVNHFLVLAFRAFSDTFQPFVSLLFFSKHESTRYENETCPSIDGEIDFFSLQEIGKRAMLTKEFRVSLSMT